MQEVTSSYNAKEIESSVQEFWANEKIYQQVKEQRKDHKSWFFVDGPPYTTGNIHLGTAWNKIIKDSILRFQRMHGFNVIDRAGYDMHGLPIEVKVESELGFKNKKDIETFGISEFIEKCKTFAITHKESMSDQFRALGIWMDFDNPYQTISPDYIEAAWWTLKKADEKGLLEKGHRVVNWCPRCGTAIADSEVEYWDEKDPSVFVKFPIVSRDSEYLVIWTTTPWTLPANVAVAVDKNFIYAKVKAEKDGVSEFLWLAKDLVEDVLKKGKYQDYSIIETKTGQELIGTKYISPLAELVPRQKEIDHKVVAADFVEMDNSGMVHIAPGHGWDDYLLGVKEGLEMFCPVNGDGRYSEAGGKYFGIYVKEADEQILTDLGDHLLAKKKITHRYGHCWRCKTPIIYRATEQWFLSVPKIKDQMMAEIKATNWYPDWAGNARFHDFVADARDWCISRQRYWGIPIPVWQCPACGKRRVIGTIAELNEAAGTNLTDPHRPYVDNVTIPCDCGHQMKRVDDIFDVWFDSAMASWATIGFPGKTDKFDELWPADFICEGQDQTRGWFYSQLGASTIAFGRSPYKNVLMHGFSLDNEGRKMSKSLGNVVAPEEVVGKFGIDVLRIYVLSTSAPWEDLRFNWDNVSTVNRTINILWNVYRFPLPYMILDNFVPASEQKGINEDEYIFRALCQMPVEDRWIISRINSVAVEIKDSMTEYHLHKVTRSLLNFILEDLSRWYVQIVRPRMWLEEDSKEKINAYETIYYVLRTLCRLMAPFCPHITESLYQNLKLKGDPQSVHMLDWFDGDSRLINTDLEKTMGIIRNFDETVQNARQAGKRKLRWPVGTIVVVAQTEDVETALHKMGELALDRANAREIRVIREMWDKIGWTAEPVMKKIGPQFGKIGPKVKAFIEGSDGTELKSLLAKNDKVITEIEGQEIVLSNEHISFVQKMPENIFSAEMPNATVYVDITLTSDIEAEGYSREIIRRVQDMRKQLDLSVDEFIRMKLVIKDERIYSLISEEWKKLISSEVRAKELLISSDDISETMQSEKGFEIEEINVIIGISKI